MKLNLGCGIYPVTGYVNVDRYRHPAVDEIVDLNDMPWPWEDGSVEEIRAVDVLEHLYPLGREKGQLNIIAVMGEIHRVLKPDGVVEIMTPSTEGPAAFQDPTHVSWWNRNTFLYFLWPSPYKHAIAPYPRFTIEDRDCGIADSDINEYGCVWAIARMKKLSAEKEAEITKKMAEQAEDLHSTPAIEGADFDDGREY